MSTSAMPTGPSGNSPTNQRMAPRGAGSAAAQRSLWELAKDASRYLRGHASPAVRLATVLLLASSLAACNASASDTTTVQPDTVAPLAREVAAGMPARAGTYDVVPGSVFRDQQGVHQMEWRAPGESGDGQVAHMSRLRIQPDDKLTLEIVNGEDPVLHLPEAENIGLIQQAQVGQARPGQQYHPPVYSSWSPFVAGMLIGSMRPAYYDPPRTIVVQNNPALGASGTTPERVSGGSVSDTAKPPAQRVTGVQSAVGGRAGGTGAGSAVSSRNSASGVTSGSSSSVTAPRSGGFSGGTGSTGGSAAS